MNPTQKRTLPRHRRTSNPRSTAQLRTATIRLNGTATPSGFGADHAQREGRRSFQRAAVRTRSQLPSRQRRAGGRENHRPPPLRSPFRPPAKPQLGCSWLLLQHRSDRKGVTFARNGPARRLPAPLRRCLTGRRMQPGKGAAQEHRREQEGEVPRIRRHFPFAGQSKVDRFVNFYRRERPASGVAFTTKDGCPGARGGKAVSAGASPPHPPSKSGVDRPPRCPP